MDDTLTPAVVNRWAAGDLRRLAGVLWAQHLDGDRFDGVEVEVRSFRAGRPMHSYRAAKTLGELVDIAAHDFGGDVFFGVHPRLASSKSGGDRSVAAFAAIFCDIDCDKAGVTREASRRAMMSVPWGGPTAVVESGGGLHGYWVYREAVEATDDNHAAHRRASAWLRAYLNRQLGTDAADDMSSRDRILRAPGSLNRKPVRVRDGVSPRVELLDLHPERMLAIEDLAEHIEPEFNPDVHAARARRTSALDPDSLPTEIPARLRGVLIAARLSFQARAPAGRVEAIKLFGCPACGQTDGGCYLTPTTGTLRTFHATSCPAAHSPGGLPLAEWVAHYAPQAAPALRSRPPNPRRSRFALGLAEFPADEMGAGAALSEASPAARRGLVWAEWGWVGPGVSPGGPRGVSRRLARERPGGGLLLPLRDGEGTVRSAAWADGGRIACGPSLADDDVAGGVLTLGSLPDTIAAGQAGAEVVVCYGVVDYLAALGAGLPRETVLGVVDHPARVFSALAAGWGGDASAPRVVVAPGPDAQRADCAPLAGVCGVAWVDLAVGLDSDILAGDDSRVLRRFRSAPWLHKPPVDIREAGDRVLQDLRQAVLLAANSSSDDRPALVIYTPPPGVGKSRQAMRLAADIAAGDFVIPLRGRRPRGSPKEIWPPAERAVAFGSPSHKFSDELALAYSTMDLDGTAQARRYYGALHHCDFAERVVEAYAYVGRPGICGRPDTNQRCPRAPVCAGADRPTAVRGEVSFIASAMTPHLAPLDFCFIDESTGVIETADVTSAQVRSVFAGRLLRRVKRWRMDANPHALEAALALDKLLSPVAAAYGADVGAGATPSFPRRLHGEPLARLLTRDPKLWAMMRRGFSAHATPPPTPSPNELRGGAHVGRHMPSMPAFRALVALTAQVERLRPQPGALVMASPPREVRPLVSLVLTPAGDYELEVRRVKPLPQAPCVMLDATGELTADEYRAAYPGRSVRLMTMDVRGARPSAAVHYDTGGVTRSALLTQRGTLRPQAAARVRNVVISLLNKVARANPRREGSPQHEIGVLTYKAVHDAITGDAFSPPHVANLNREMAGRGASLRVGYFGRDDRGTNLFERVGGLAVIGDATPNIGSVEADCTLLGLDPADVTRARARAIVTQAIYRARHTRRRHGDEPVLIFAGRAPPMLPGVAWDVEPMPGTTASAAHGLAYEMLCFAAAELGCAGYAVLQRFDWARFPSDTDPWPLVTRDGVKEALRVFRAERPAWAPYVVSTGARGRPVTLLAESPEDASFWARCYMPMGATMTAQR